MHFVLETPLHHPRSKILKNFASTSWEMQLSNLMPSIGQLNATTLSDAKILSVRGVGGAPLALFFLSPGLSSQNIPKA
jgi:hypothetical protein